MHRRHLSVLAVSAILLIASSVIWFRSVEPKYQGKSLGKWLKEFDAWEGEPTEANFQEPVVKAIRKLGTNAIPVIIELLRSRESQFTRVMDRALANQSFVRFHPTPTLFQRRWRALNACKVLGPSAAAAIPELIALLENDDLAWHAENALIGIGDAAVDPLTKALSNQSVRVRYCATSALGS